MNSYAKYQLRLAKERREDEYRVAADSRRFARPSSQPNRFRRFAGQSIVRLGERLVGDPNLELARSR
ncbi:MAG TPA: hypothetical protein VFO05_05190 [Candidatus Limnocylindrales bacterium]|nr:hypothetical protein [Candidatus Limnocylindrales bacterium]